MRVSLSTNQSNIKFQRGKAELYKKAWEKFDTQMLMTPEIALKRAKHTATGMALGAMVATLAGLLIPTSLVFEAAVGAIWGSLSGAATSVIKTFIDFAETVKKDENNTQKNL